MEIDAGLALFAIILALYGGLGILLSRGSITMPIVFVIVGVTLGRFIIGLLPVTTAIELIKVLTEVTLAILLFADASTLSFLRIQHDIAVPARLLGIGLPLTIGLGALLAFLLFPASGIGFALLVASILAPTDAALGLPIFNNRRVPVRIRRALNVESGLNDGIATPFVTLFLSLAVAEANASEGGWLLHAAEQIALAVLVGAVVGYAGGRLLVYAHRRGWTNGSPLQFAVLALGLASYLGSIAIGGNGFVAAFVGGIAFGAGSHGDLAESAEYSESTGTFLSVLVWTCFGAVFVVPGILEDPNPRAFVYALLSLTVIRMLPVFLALRGVRFRVDTRLLMGWFGPRGLASVVFGLMAVRAFDEAGMETHLLASIITWTVLLSVFAHGLSAQPLAGWYPRRLETAGAEAPESVEVPEVRTRRGLVSGGSPAS